MKKKKDKSLDNNNDKLKNCFFIFDDFLERDIVDELYKSILDNDFEKLPFNRLVVFDPHYPHCVLNIKKGTTKDTPRIGITMAAWDHEISIP